MKTCKKCGMEKPETDFDRYGYDPSKPLKIVCRECSNARKAAKLRGTKFCSKCNVEKPVTDYTRRGRGCGELLGSRCKECAAQDRVAWRRANPQKARASYKKWACKNHHKKQLRHRYGLSVAEYQERLLLQEGVCAICKRSDAFRKHLSVDHIHGTNPPIIRGLLCGHCNSAIGFFQDSPKLLLTAVEYLRNAKPIPAGLMPC